MNMLLDINYPDGFFCESHLD